MQGAQGRDVRLLLKRFHWRRDRSTQFTTFRAGDEFRLVFGRGPRAVKRKRRPREKRPRKFRREGAGQRALFPFTALTFHCDLSGRSSPLRLRLLPKLACAPNSVPREVAASSARLKIRADDFISLPLERIETSVKKRESS